MFEVSGVQEDLAMAALRLAIHKLPIAAKAVHRDGVAVGG
jgi:ribosomal protein L16/L10AE